MFLIVDKFDSFDHLTGFNHSPEKGCKLKIKSYFIVLKKSGFLLIQYNPMGQ